MQALHSLCVPETYPRLFAAAERWGVAHGCHALWVETQDNNVAAVRFYLRQGCELASVRDDAYPDHPDELQLIFRKAIVRA